MAGQKGRSLVIKVESAPASGTYNTVGGLEDTSISYSDEFVEITNKDSAGEREGLAGAGTRGVDVSGSGTFLDDANLQLMIDAVQAGTDLNYQLVTPGTSNPETATGAFHLSSFERAGAHNGKVTYSLSLVSSGAIVYT